ALMLQPTPAGRGSTYVVMGRGPSGTRELARGPENMMQFDITGVDVVELRPEAGGEVTTLARATVARPGTRPTSGVPGPRAPRPLSPPAAARRLRTWAETAGRPAPWWPANPPRRRGARP